MELLQLVLLLAFGRKMMTFHKLLNYSTVLVSGAIASTTAGATTSPTGYTTTVNQETTTFVEETTLGYENTTSGYEDTTTGPDDTSTIYPQTTNGDETTSGNQNTTNTDETTSGYVETTNAGEKTSGYEETTSGTEDNSTNTTPTWEVTDQTSVAPSSSGSSSNDSTPPSSSGIFTSSLYGGSNPFSGVVFEPESSPLPSPSGPMCDACNCNNQVDVGYPQPCKCPNGQTKKTTTGNLVCCKAWPTTNWSWPRKCEGATLSAQNYKSFPCGPLVEKNCGQCTSGNYQTITIAGTTACCCNEIPKPV